MSTPASAYDNVNWSILEKENPALFRQVKPHIIRGKVTSLPAANEVDVLRWIVEQRAKEKAANDAAKAKADEAERHRKAVAERDARRRAEFQAQHGAATEEANQYAGLQRILQYAQERGLAEDRENARLITEWCISHGGLNPDAVDRAIVALSSQLIWSTFAARLRS